MGRFVGGVVLIGLGLFLGASMTFAIGFSHFGDSADDPTWYWGAEDTTKVLVIGGIPFAAGVWLVLSGLSHEMAETAGRFRAGRFRAGITLIVVGAVFSLFAWRIVAWDRGYYYGMSVPSGDYLFAAFVGVVPCLVGVWLLVSAHRRASPGSRVGAGRSPSPPAPGARG